MKENAAWLLRRYRDRALPDWRMRQVLERELNRLVSDYSALLPEMDELRRAALDRLDGFDAASDQALQWLGERRFDLALQEIQKAEEKLGELRRCMAVAVDWRRASAALEGVEDLLSPELESQATVRVLHRLRDLARSLLDQGETRKARFVVFLLAEQISLLMVRHRGELNAGCVRMLSDLAAQNETAAVARIKKLGQEGYHRLAERLTEDLAVELAVTDRAQRTSAAGSFSRVISSDLAALRQQAQSVRAALTQWLEISS